MRATSAPLLVCLALVVALGTIHGYSTDRWGPSGQLQQALDGLHQIPTHFGDWEGEDLPADADDMSRLGIQGYIHRRFRDHVSGESVLLLILCGRGGPISVHTPDVCYVNAGYKQLSATSLQEIESNDNKKHSFTVAHFGKPGGVVPIQLEIFWAWSRDSNEWRSPENPRLSLARSPALYKLYLIREFVPGTRSETKDTCQTFLRHALPAIRQTLPHASP